MSRLLFAHNVRILQRAKFAAQHCTLVFSFGIGCVVLQAQSNVPSISSQPTKQSLRILDGDIVAPGVTAALGQQNGAALNEIKEHLSVVGSASWLGIQGTGKIVYGARDSTAYPATLSILGKNKFRLDAQTSKGEMSLRIHGPVGKMNGTGAPEETISPDAATAGIFPFEAVLSGTLDCCVDHGLTTVGSIQLHRITVEIPATRPTIPLRSRDK